MRNLAHNLWESRVDLPFLALRAAIDLDNLIGKRSEDLKAINQLVEMISQELVLSACETTSMAQLNPATAVVLNYAIDDSKISTAQTKISELIRETRQIVQSLREVAENTQKALAEEPETIEQLKSFCLALSKRALASEAPSYEEESQHPYRR